MNKNVAMLWVVGFLLATAVDAQAFGRRNGGGLFHRGARCNGAVESCGSAPVHHRRLHCRQTSHGHCCGVIGGGPGCPTGNCAWLNGGLCEAAPSNVATAVETQSAGNEATVVAHAETCFDAYTQQDAARTILSGLPDSYVLRLEAGTNGRYSCYLITN